MIVRGFGPRREIPRREAFLRVLAPSSDPCQSRHARSLSQHDCSVFRERFGHQGETSGGSVGASSIDALAIRIKGSRRRHCAAP